MRQHARCRHIMHYRLAATSCTLLPHHVPPPHMLPPSRHISELAAVTPAWERVTAAIEADAEAKKVLGEWLEVCG